MSASDYGDKRWGIVLSDGTTRYFMADRVEFTSSGGVTLWGHSRSRTVDATLETFALAAFAAGQWRNVFAASVLDGSAMAED
jgi:hypothetical protein